MSEKERIRLSVMKQVREEDLKLVEASEVLGVSYRQARFEVWRREFNEERPHEALGMKRPAQV